MYRDNPGPSSERNERSETSVGNGIKTMNHTNSKDSMLILHGVGREGITSIGWTWSIEGYTQDIVGLVDSDLIHSLNSIPGFHFRSSSRCSALEVSVDIAMYTKLQCICTLVNLSINLHKWNLFTNDPGLSKSRQTLSQLYLFDIG
jgi:hypothetical protein